MAYNILYACNDNFKPAKWWQVEQYDLKDECPLAINTYRIFQDDLFFRLLDCMNGNTIEVLNQLNNKYDLYLCTIGTIKNLYLKSLWVESNIPFIKNKILLNNQNNKMDKSVINMKDSVFVDDVLSNLNSSNAELKIVFGDKYEWNKTSTHQRCYNWTDIENILL